MHWLRQALDTQRVQLQLRADLQVRMRLAARRAPFTSMSPFVAAISWRTVRSTSAFSFTRRFDTRNIEAMAMGARRIAANRG